MNRELRRVLLSATFVTFIFGLVPGTKAAVTNTNLKIYVDAANSSSYSGSGTTINDLNPNVAATNGTINALTFDNSAASAGGAFTADAAGDYINFGNGTTGSSQNPSGDFSVEMWVKTPMTWAAGWNILASKWFTNTAGTEAQDWHYAFYPYSGSDVNTIRQNLYTAATGSNAAMFGNDTYTTNTWYQIGFVINNGGQMNFIKNGRFDGGFSPVSHTVQTTAQLWVGDGRGSGTLGMLGKYAIFRFYHKALTAAEVRANFENDGPRFGLFSPATISISASAAKKTVATNIVATTSSAATVTFRANGRVINKCKDLATNGSKQATCAWKPLTHGATTLTATSVSLDTSTTSTGATSQPLILAVGKRTTAR